MTNTVGNHHSTFPPITHPQAGSKPAATGTAATAPAGSAAHTGTEASAAGSSMSPMPSLPTGLVGHHVDTTA
ncbi:hypothetical protein [Paraburkholderia sp.]|uniref:hypothetical protein n=1 Tax=Paraburkholderia sp. TaxID=1926495 RepID=UPI003D6DB0DC